MTEWQGRSSFSASRELERFISKIEVTPTCWRWRAGTTRDGYGRMSFRGRWTGAHRVAWELFRFPIPAGLHVCHRCDVRDCVRPAHLFLGTNADNVEDKMVKARRGRTAKLTPTAVVSIRERHAAGDSQTALARDFGVAVSAINKVVHRRSWKHVP